MKFHFHPDAEAEFDRAVEYYEQFQPGLGIEFTEEVYATITRIIQYPDAWSTLSKNSRGCLVSRFPYGVIRLCHNSFSVTLNSFQGLV